MKVLFKTPHGSRLYGLHNENSDYDYYIVVDRVKKKRKHYAKQTIVDDIDSTVVDFGTFYSMCVGGVPQALEACFSRLAIVDEIGAWRNAFRASTDVYERYLRTIKSFALTDEYKSKRHALRLAMNLRVMANTGRFNPTLDDMQIMCVNEWATCSTEDVYEIAKGIAWEVY